MHTSHTILESSIAHALAILGDRWALLILRDEFLGRRRFNELLETTGATKGTLTKRLKSLVYHGILYKNPYCQSPPRFEYRLTDKGFALYDWALSLWWWEHKWGPNASPQLPPKLQHRSCGHTLDPMAMCEYCGDRLTIEDISYLEKPGSGSPQRIINRDSVRRSRNSANESNNGDGFLFHAADMLGDPWTPLVLAIVYMGKHRFDEMQQALTIATNILADRLKYLVDGNVLSRRVYNENSQRYEYFLTEKGSDLCLAILAMYKWAQEWLPLDEESPFLLHHRCNEESAKFNFRCSHCHQVVDAREISFGE